MHWIAGRANILCKYLICTFIILGVAFALPFLCCFHKLKFLVIKCLKQILLHCTSNCISLKRVSQIFKTLFQTGNVDIFILCGIFFGRYAQLKSSFSDKKTSAVKQRYALVEKLSMINMAKYQKKTSSSTEIGALQCKTTLITLMGMHL